MASDVSSEVGDHPGLVSVEEQRSAVTFSQSEDLPCSREEYRALHRLVEKRQDMDAVATP